MAPGAPYPDLSKMDAALSAGLTELNLVGRSQAEAVQSPSAGMRGLSIVHGHLFAAKRGPRAAASFRILNRLVDGAFGQFCLYRCARR